MTKSRSKLAFFLMALLWGASYAVQKPLLQFIDPVVFTFWNFFLSGVLFLFYAVVNKLPLMYRWREGIVLGLFLSGVEIFEMVGLKMTDSSANTVFITNTGMLVIPFLGWFLFKDKVKMEDGIAILIAVIGMYLLVGGLNGFSFGDGVLVLSALASALYFLYAERFAAERASHITSLCVQQFFMISLVCLVWGTFAGTTFAVPRSLHLELLWQIGLFTTLPFAIIQWASRYADEMIAAVYDGIVEPLTGAIFSWVIFMEATSFSKVFGGILMIISFVFAAAFSERHVLRHMFVNFFK